MPHIIIEYSANIENKLDVGGLIDKLHAAAVATNFSELGGIRTRAGRRDHFKIADGDPQNGFVAIIVRIGHGRPVEKRKQFGEALFEAASKHMDPLFAAIPVALSLDVQEIDPVVTFKRNNIHAHLKARESAA